MGRKMKRSKYRIYLFFKRFFDIIGSIFGLLILWPVFMIIACLIKLDDNGPVIFAQIRVGKNEKKFKMYKFRSMVVDADMKKQQLISNYSVDSKLFKLKKDPRVTRVGDFLRKYSLDELPQLINILIGNMTLVGPRPPLVSEVLKYTNSEKKRLTVTPGLTGLWQVSGRSNLSFDEMVSLDIEYISTRNSIIDFKIILKTIILIFLKDKNGAY